MLKDKRYIIGIISLVFVLVLSFGAILKANANQDFWDLVAEKLAMQLAGTIGSPEGMLGASGTRFPNGISADSTSPSAGEVRGTTLTTTGAATIGGNATVSGNLAITGNTSQTPGRITATTTLTTSSANVQLIDASASQITVTLPAVTATGTSFMVQVAGALTGPSVQITSAEKDNISGTLIVAGAVVDCRDEDYINIITDGEAIGDYVEFYSIGSQWLLVDSGVLTTGKMTCTDPS